METKVIKRDGSLEPFDRGKIVRVVQAAGLDLNQADSLSLSIENWVKSLGEEKIHSLTIRDQVLKELEKIDTYAADLFNQYQKSKNLIT